MNAPASEQKNEEGGMLVAALAGGAILIAVALVIFSGGDKENAGEADETQAVSANVDAKTGKGSPSAFKARQVDAAAGAKNGGPQAAIDPAGGTHRTTRMVTGEGMAAAPDVKGPPEFETKEDERKWWNRQLEGAQTLKDRRERALAKLPELEAQISESNNPEAARASFEKKRESLEAALERSVEKIADIEAKLAEI